MEGEREGGKFIYKQEEPIFKSIDNMSYVPPEELTHFLFPTIAGAPMGTMGEFSESDDCTVMTGKNVSAC